MSVSRFIGGKLDVFRADFIRKAIDELGYAPNVAARNLASAGSLKIGLMYGNPSASFSDEFLVALLESSSGLGCQLLVEKCTDASRHRASTKKLLLRGVDGVILPTPLCDSPAIIEQFDTAGVVTVAVGSGREIAVGLSVRIDNFRAAERMTEFLLSEGHREVGFILGHPKQVDSTQRYEGFVSAMRAAGLSVRSDWVKQGLYTYQSGFLAATQLLEGTDRPTAIFASNDDMAAGAMAAAHRRKFEVPQDLSIVGFDDAPVASTLWPGLTTIRQPVPEMTRLALEMLLAEIRRRRAGKVPRSRQELVRLTLVKRESVASPPISIDR